MNFRPLVVALAFTPSIAFSAATITDADAKYSNAVDRRCNALKSSGAISEAVTLQNNPLFVVNPDAGCDLGLSLPGLPSFGISMQGVDACKLVQAVTGDTVDAVNRRAQQALDGALGDAGLNPNGENFNIDVGDQLGVEGNTGGQNTDLLIIEN